MAYITIEQILADIPRAHLIQALDDSSSGVIDEEIWDAIQDSVTRAIHAPLASRYAVPFAEPYPAVIAHAASVFTLEKLIARRGIPAEQNPWTTQADSLRSRLSDIGTGKEALQLATAPATPPISVISEPAGTVPSSRLNG